LELKTNVISRLFNKSAGTASPEYTILAGKSVKIPKLTPAKFKALLERVETLPQIIASVLTSHHSEDFVATAIVGANMAMDEAVSIVAVLADVDREVIDNDAGFDEISEFIRLTLEKNDLQRALKNFRAVLGHFRARPTADGN
jgi:hypothetical protein